MNEKQTHDLLQDTEEQAAELAVWAVQAILTRANELRIPHIAVLAAAAATAATIEKAMIEMAEAKPDTAVNGARIAKQAFAYGLRLGRQSIDVRAMTDLD